jgi:hypothetical protein
VAKPCCVVLAAGGKKLYVLAAGGNFIKAAGGNALLCSTGRRWQKVVCVSRRWQFYQGRRWLVFPCCVAIWPQVAICNGRRWQFDMAADGNLRPCYIYYAAGGNPLDTPQSINQPPPPVINQRQQKPSNCCIKNNCTISVFLKVLKGAYPALVGR